MEGFISVENLGNTFRGIPFFSFLPVYCFIWRKILTGFSSHKESAPGLGWLPGILRPLRERLHGKKMGGDKAVGEGVTVLSSASTPA